MAEYEISISGVHYAANGDSVAGQKDTEEMHMRTRELLSRIDRVRPIVTLSPAPENHVHERALQARALGKRIGRVALECVDLVWDLLRASGMPMLLAKVKEVAVRNHGYAVVTVSAEALQQTQPTVASETEWGPEEFTIDDVMRCFGLAQNNSARARVFRLQKDGLVEKVDEFVDNGTTKAKYKKTGAVMI